MSWLWQCKRLLLLCASLLGSEISDPKDILLQTAAARLLVVLADAALWKCCLAGRIPDHEVLEVLVLCLLLATHEVYVSDPRLVSY